MPCSANAFSTRQHGPHLHGVEQRWSFTATTPPYPSRLSGFPPLPPGGTFRNAGARQRLVTPTGGARRLGSVVSGDAHVCAFVLRREARDYFQCDASRFCGIPSKWNIERQPTRAARKKDAALTSIGSRECDESLHLARGPNFEFHARSIRPYLGDGPTPFGGHS
jgi:hypothetical protein